MTAGLNIPFCLRRLFVGLQAVVKILREDCKGRMHWGKAGWDKWANCFDGATEYGESWCNFGCAVKVILSRRSMPIFEGLRHAALAIHFGISLDLFGSTACLLSFPVALQALLSLLCCGVGVGPIQQVRCSDRHLGLASNTQRCGSAICAVLRRGWL